MFSLAHFCELNSAGEAVLLCLEAEHLDYVRKETEPIVQRSAISSAVQHVK